MLRFSPNTFANYPLDKAGHRRKDAAWLAAARAAPETRLTPLQAGAPAIRDDALCWVASSEAPGDALLFFLGVDSSGAARFALEAKSAPPGAAFVEMRAAAASLPGADVAVAGCARSLFEWHARHKFCANCGAPTNVTEAGWKRECPACAAEHFPRVDPVVIMLAARGDNCLLGRQQRFAPNMYSALAGFVEPGESAEEACARELFEEAGVVATRVTYHSTQPWPFPSSLMIGMLAEVGGAALTIDKHELEDARWFSRDEARALIERRHPILRAPPPLAIAHQLIKAWAFA